MRDALPLRWLDCDGWIVLSGTADAAGEIRASALSRCDASGAVAYISLAADAGDALMEDMAELGAPTGYLVDLEEADNNEIHERLSGAGMIVIEAGDELARLRRLMAGTAGHALKEALKGGALALFEGAAASLAGTWTLENGEFRRGQKLVENAFILADARSIAEADLAESALADERAAVGIAIEPGAALVLGPGGSIETWGEGQVTFSLGSSALLAASK